MIQPFTHGAEMTLCDVEAPEPTRLIGIIWPGVTASGEGANLETVIAITRARAEDLALTDVAAMLGDVLATLGFPDAPQGGDGG